MGFSVVDVRDIAALQLLAMTTSSAAGQRLGDPARKVPTGVVRKL
jgi:hypothetical protein